jgi:hypothetical protein
VVEVAEGCTYVQGEMEASRGEEYVSLQQAEILHFDLYFNKIEILYFKSSLDLHFNFYFCVSNR